MRVAVLSLHTAPTAAPGAGDAGGLNVFVRSVGAELARRGVGAQVHTRPLDGPVPGVAAFARAVLETPRPDVIHAHYWLSGLAALRLKERWRVPLVVSFHTLARVKQRGGEAADPRRERAERRVIDGADWVIASTATERRELIDLYGAAPARVVVVTPGVDVERFRPGDRAAARRRYSCDGPTVAFVGRLAALKGPELAVDAVARLPGVRLLVAGGDTASSGIATLRARAAARGAAERVRFLGPVAHEELPELYRAADAIVMPSASESFGLVAAEATACGTPVVATAVGGLRHVVRDGVNGVLVEQRTAAGFAAGLTRALGLRPGGAPGGCSWSRTASQLVDVYRRRRAS